MSARLPSLDTLLDRSVLGGYTSVGYRLRRASWPREDLSLTGRRVLVTGATSGIGFAAAEQLAEQGANLVLLARDEERGRAAAGRLGERGPGAVVAVELCDLSDLDSVRACASRLQAQGAVDVLVNNAGVLPERYTLTPDGFELAFATNVLGPFLLTSLLTEQLQAARAARVVTVSSGGMYTTGLPSPAQAGPEGFDGARVYAGTKRQEVALSEQWAERFAGSGIAFFAMHPGWVDTPGLRSSLPSFRRLTKPLLRDAAAGADTIVWLAASRSLDGDSGGFWHDRRRRPEHLLPRTRESAEEREALWQQCRRLCGLGED